MRLGPLPHDGEDIWPWLVMEALWGVLTICLTNMTFLLPLHTHTWGTPEDNNSAKNTSIPCLDKADNLGQSDVNVYLGNQ